MSTLRLRPLRVDDENAVRAAQEEMRADDFTFATFFDDGMSWTDYLEQLAAQEWGNAEFGRVPGTLLIAEADGEIVGRTSIRFELNDWLLECGGHIGYGVRPAYRRRGHAREILRQSLIVARARGVGRVLMTCDDDNAGSAATIEGAGGVRDPGRPTGQHDGIPVRRYWIS